MPDHEPPNQDPAALTEDPDDLAVGTFEGSARHHGVLSAFDSLGNRDFCTLSLGMLLSKAAMQFNVVAHAWLAYHISGSPLALGIVLVVRGLPQVALSPLPGVMADRLDKRKVVLASQCLLSPCTEQRSADPSRSHSGVALGRCRPGHAT